MSQAALVEPEAPDTEQQQGLYALSQPLRNERQEQFCQAVAKGHTPAIAYRSAYAEASEVASWPSANRLLRQDTICRRIAQIRTDQEPKTLTKARKLQLCAEIAEQRRPNKVIKTPRGTEEHFESLRAIELAAKLDGDLAPSETTGILVVNQVRISLGGAVTQASPSPLQSAVGAVVDVTSAALPAS